MVGIAGIDQMKGSRGLRLFQYPHDCRYPYPQLFGDLAFASTGYSKAVDRLFDFSGHLGPSQYLPLRPRTRQPRLDPLLYHRPLKLSKYSAHLEHGLSGRCGRVDALLMTIEVNAFCMDLTQELH